MFSCKFSLAQLHEKSVHNQRAAKKINQYLESRLLYDDFK